MHIEQNGSRRLVMKVQEGVLGWFYTARRCVVRFARHRFATGYTLSWVCIGSFCRYHRTQVLVHHRPYHTSPTLCLSLDAVFHTLPPTSDPMPIAVARRVTSRAHDSYTVANTNVVGDSSTASPHCYSRGLAMPDIHSCCVKAKRTLDWEYGQVLISVPQKQSTV